MAAGSGVRSVFADCGFVQRLVAVVADSGPLLHSWVEEMADERHVEMRSWRYPPPFDSQGYRSITPCLDRPPRGWDTRWEDPRRSRLRGLLGRLLSDSSRASARNS